MIRAVGFDLGETLVEYEGVPLNWEAEYPAALSAVASLWCDGLSDHQMDRGISVLRGFNMRVMPRTVEVGHTVVFAELLEALGAPAGHESLVDLAADAFFAVFQRRARPFPEVSDAIEALVAMDIGVGVLTDVPYGMPRRLVASDLDTAGLGFLGSTLLTSTEVGTRKPDPRGFLQLAALLGCSPAEALYVGNEEKDIRGAIAAGMRAVLVWRGEGVPPDWGQDRSVFGLDGLIQLMPLSNKRIEQNASR